MALNTVMLNVVTLNAVMLSVVAPNLDQNYFSWYIMRQYLILMGPVSVKSLLGNWDHIIKISYSS